VSEATEELLPPTAAMSDETPEQPLVVTTQRDVQRTALRDLVALATESAATETEIEQRFQLASEEAEKELQTTRWAAEQRAKSAKDAARQKHQERLAQLEAKYLADAAALKKRGESARRKVAADHDPQQHQLKEKYDQAVWLADSVLESTQGGIEEELKKKKAQIADEHAVLGEAEKRAAELMHTYGITAPAIDAPAGALQGDADSAFAAARDAGQAAIQQLASLSSAQLFVGARPYIIPIIAVLIAGGAAQFLSKNPTVPQWQPIGIYAGAALAVVIVIGILIRMAANRKAQRIYLQIGQSILTARQAADQQLANAVKLHDDNLVEAQKTRDAEVDKIKRRVAPYLAKIKASREAALQAATAEQTRLAASLEQQRATVRKDIDDRLTKTVAEIKQKLQSEQQKAQEVYEQKTESGRSGYGAARSHLERRLKDGLASTQSPIEDTSGIGQGAPNWAATDWNTWKPTKHFASVVRFGELGIDLKKIADSVPRKGDLKLALPPPYSVPAMLAFPSQSSLLVEADREGREAAMRILQMTMVRLLTSLPPGRVHFIMLDPIGLGQNFAGFMHLAEFDKATVTSRIYSSTEDINQRLVDLTDHMQTVIQKYLRNEFETIDDYNAQAGELSEPYRFLVIADFPVGFEGEALRHLSSIATSGARCGVYTLIARDLRQDIAGGTHLDDLSAHSTVLRQDGDKFIWVDDVYQQFPLALDPPPDDETLTKILQIVGSKAKDAKRVEVSFDTIAPKLPDFWTRRGDDELVVPIGRMGATSLQQMRLGRGVAQHMIIAGKTGSGKSTLLHAMVTNMAMWFSPDEIELYLIDFKKGVEFKTYATHALPHARAIAVESDREFGISVLQRLDGELTRRGDIFRKIGVQNLKDYRAADPDGVMPRTLLIIDEYQEFFSEDDKLAADANLLIDRLVRQGRAFGINVILGSQTIGGSSGLSRSTLGQMAVRVALMTSEADSQLILGDGNSAARLLSRPGEAIYNDQGGLVEGNSPFQVAYLSDERRDVYLDQVNKKVAEFVERHKRRPAPPIVFEGNAPADITTNAFLADLIKSPTWPEPKNAVVGWMGDPVAIKDPAAATFRRQSGANMMIIGQSEENAIAINAAVMVSLAAQHKPDAGKFYVFDGNASDSIYINVFPTLKSMLPHDVKMVEWRAVDEAFAELNEEFKRRQGGEDGPSIFVFIYGLQRYRMLRKTEESFSFSATSDEEGEKKIAPDKIFNDLIREGPALGIHIITWIDTPSAIDRTFDRGMLREFDTRVLFQMSAADSSNLIDSPTANKLGFYRALQYSEEQGSMEKFRPYAMPTKEWLENMKARFAAKK
jgi:DNA segregation ATPase FtsK/SpoIIIE-like protein